MSQRHRFPFSTTPTGWYRVAYSHDIAGGQALPLYYFGRDLVCYRGASGAVHVFDAFCPHLGAHLGYGGRVEGDNIVCPFHSWVFDSSGVNVCVPYADRVNRKAQLTHRPAAEANGEVYVWFDEGNRPPWWDVPRLLEEGDDRYVWHPGRRWTIRTHVQEVLENAVDIAHFPSVHGMADFGMVDLEEEGPMLRASNDVTFVTPRGNVNGTLISELWGLGINHVRPTGLVDAVAIFATTPVDDELTEIGYTFFVPRGDEANDGSAISNIGRGLIDQFHLGAMQDIPIWEHKCYHLTPALAAGDGPIMAFRRWAHQFYAA